MKNGKRLSRKQKEFLSSKGLDPQDYLVVKDTSTEVQFVHRNTNKVKAFEKAS